MRIETIEVSLTKAKRGSMDTLAGSVLVCALPELALSISRFQPRVALPSLGAMHTVGVVLVSYANIRNSCRS